MLLMQYSNYANILCWCFNMMFTRWDRWVYVHWWYMCMSMPWACISIVLDSKYVWLWNASGGMSSGVLEASSSQSRPFPRHVASRTLQPSQSMAWTPSREFKKFNTSQPNQFKKFKKLVLGGSRPYGNLFNSFNWFSWEVLIFFNYEGVPAQLKNIKK